MSIWIAGLGGRRGGGEEAPRLRYHQPALSSAHQPLGCGRELAHFDQRRIGIAGKRAAAKGSMNSLEPSNQDDEIVTPGKERDAAIAGSIDGADQDPALGHLAFEYLNRSKCRLHNRCELSS